MEGIVENSTALIICTTKLCLHFRLDTIQTICYSNDLPFKQFLMLVEVVVVEMVMKKMMEGRMLRQQSHLRNELSISLIKIELQFLSLKTL